MSGQTATSGARREGDRVRASRAEHLAAGPAKADSPTDDSRRDWAGWTVTHDFFYQDGGAEWVTKTLVEDALPGSSLGYLSGDPELVAATITADAKQLAPKLVSAWNYRAITPLYPRILNARSPIEGDVLASSYAFCHQVPNSGRLIVYCHSPLRQAWSGALVYAKQGPRTERAATRLFGENLRDRDRLAAKRATVYVATSRAVQARVSRFYGIKNAPILPPPIDDRCYFRAPEIEPRSNSYLWVGRITEPYKRLGLTIESFRQSPERQLIVVGDGRDRQRLEATAPENVRFTGWLTRTEIGGLYRSATAVIFPSEDDFGLVPVEAMACGTPTIALNAGGARDTVWDGITGVFFDEPTVRSLTEALARFEQEVWDAKVIAEHAASYARASFASRIRQLIDTLPA